MMEWQYSGYNWAFKWIESIFSQNRLTSYPLPEKNHKKQLINTGSFSIALDYLVGQAVNPTMEKKDVGDNQYTDQPNQ